MTAGTAGEITHSRLGGPPEDGRGRRGARVGRLLPAVIVSLALGWVFAASALATPVVYSATQTIPVPPASNYAGSGGGDGWAVSLSTDSVYNVFHHGRTVTVACHKQSDAQACWPTRTITDEHGNNFSSSGHPGAYLDQGTQKLWVYATRYSDQTAGLVCVDTTQAATISNPFCGFVALTPAGDAPLNPNGISGLSPPMQYGSRLYSFNYVSGYGASGAKNELLCFDVSTQSACGGQPFAVSLGEGNLSDSGWPSPATALIGSQMIIPVNMSGTNRLACFDATAQSSCGGDGWPATLSFSYAGAYGSPFPLLDTTGRPIGFCLPTGADQCFTSAGASAPTPSGMAGVIHGNDGWNGPAFVLGPRVYVADGNYNQVECYDYSTSSSCSNFPRSFSNLGYLYTVNPDPQRPTCIWVNADNGGAQIQNFDAYTGGACGQGAIRVLASQFVVPQQACYPNSYQSLQILSPDRSTYSSGSVQFDDGDATPISDAPSRPLDGTGSVDLNGLSLNTATGLPQFLITLNGNEGAPGEVVVKLTWTAPYDPSCIGPSAQVSKLPTTTTTSLSGGGQSGTAITVSAGTQVSDSATLSGLNAGQAGGTVRYTWYSDSSCSTVVSAGTDQPITTPGTLPGSAPVTLSNPGTYYAVASYSGDGADAGSQSRCGDETVVAQAPTSTGPRPTLWTLAVAMAGNGQGSVRDSSGQLSCRPTCSHSYASGTHLTLVAAPVAGSKFVGWRGAGCTGNGRCQLTLNAVTTVTAVFEKVVRREAPRLRFGSEKRVSGKPGERSGAGGGIVISPWQKNCETELAMIADAGCSLLRIEVSGTIAKRATGHIIVKVYSLFGHREAPAKISNGRWRLRLRVPGMNRDPLAPLYLIVIHYDGDRTTHAGTIRRLVRIESESAGLGPV